MLWSAAAMGMGPLARLMRIVLPAALPEILVGCRTGLVLALITMVTSEMIARQTGVGNILFNSLDDGAVRHGLRHDRHHRRARLRARRRRSRRCAAGSSRWAEPIARSRRGNDMTRSDRSVGALIGIMPIALIIGVWQAIAASGLAPPSLLPPPAAVFARLVRAARLARLPRSRRAPRLFRPVRRLRHRGRDRRHASASPRPAAGRSRRWCEPLVRVLAPVPKIALYPAFILIARLRERVQDRARGRRCGVPDPARHPPGHVGGRAEARVVGARGRHLAAALPRHRGAAGGAAVRC